MKNVRKKLLAFLKIGISPESLALSVGLGIALGLIPALGTTTLLCALAAFLFRLNLAAIQLMNFMVYPLQIVLLIPFMQTGSRLFGNKPIPFSFQQLEEMLETDLWGTVTGLWITTMQAVAAWMLVAPLIVGLVFVVLTPLLRKMNLE